MPQQNVTSPRAGAGQQPTTSLPTLPRLDSPEGLATVTLPGLSSFSVREFDSQMKNLIGNLAARSPYLREVGAAALEKNYEFVLHDGSRRDLPAEVHAMMKDDRFGALTYVDSNKVVFNPIAIRAEAERRGVSDGQILVEVLANEGVHILLDQQIPRFSREQSRTAFETAARSEQWTQAELSYQKLAVEEIASELAMITVRRQFADPQFQFSSEDLQARRYQYRDIKETVAERAFSRMFEGAEFRRNGQTPADRMMTRRVHVFLDGDADKQVMEMLKKYKLTTAE